MTKAFKDYVIALTVLTLCGLSAWHSTGAQKSDLHNLGHHKFPITTTSLEAQRAFNRGLTWAYSFGHFAAEQEFRAALAADSNCAMAWWGIALDRKSTRLNSSHIP